MLEKFLTHYVWHSSDIRRENNNKYWQRLESRLIEMKKRRRRLLASISEREDKLVDYENDFKDKETKKNKLIKSFCA